MPTPDMSDEELDRLFQGGAEAYPDEVSLSGWLRLQEQLDEQTRRHLLQRQVRRRVAGWFAAELALVLLLALFWQSKQWWQQGRLSSAARPQTGIAAAPLLATTPRTGSLKRPKTGVINAVATRPNTASRVNTSGTTRIPVPETAAAVTPTSLRLTRQTVAQQNSTRRLGLIPAKTTKAPASSGSETAATAGTAGSTGLNFPARTSPTAGSGRTGALAPGPISSASGSGVALNAGSGSLGPEETGGAAAAGSAAPTGAATAVGTAVTRNGTASAAAQDSATATTAPAATPADSAETTPARVKPAYRLLVGIVGGPEATAVLPGPAPRIGGTVGLALEYRVTPRLRVRTGLVRSIKRYAAKGSDYNPPADYWTHRIPIDQVNANCRILEIPVDVRYDVVLRPTNTFYATAGLTSLLMRNERYTYLYELNGNYISRTWSLARGSNAAFSLLQLSVGVEHAVGGRCTVQAEPFVKVPLGGVGFGQIKLSSSGILLGIKYGLLRPRTVAP